MISGLWKILRKLDLKPIKLANPKYIAKPYEQMTYLGQRVQVDIEIVPSVCIVGDAKAEKKKFYQYTAIDEYFYATHTFYSFEDFKSQLKLHLRKYNNFPMRLLNWLSPKQFLLNYKKMYLTSL